MWPNNYGLNCNLNKPSQAKQRSTYCDALNQKLDEASLALTPSKPHPSAVVHGIMQYIRRGERAGNCQMRGRALPSHSWPERAHVDTQHQHSMSMSRAHTHWRPCMPSFAGGMHASYDVCYAWRGVRVHTKQARSQKL